MQEITFKIPEGSELSVKHAVEVAISNFYRSQFTETPVEEKVEFKNAMSDFRAENSFEEKKIEIITDDLQVDKL